MESDKPETQLTEAIEDNGGPLSHSDALAALGGGFRAEVLVDQIATIEERDDEKFVVGVNGERFDFSEDDDDTPSDAVESAETDSSDETTNDTSDETAAFSAAAETAQTPANSDGRDWYDLAGLRVTVDPREEAVGDRTGEDYYGVAVLDNGREDTPSPETAYYPIKLGGGRDSEEVIGRLLGFKRYPVLLEGEAGTGKNTAFQNFAAQTNRPMQRMDFGDDTTVFDLIGEKDIVGGSTVYILGSLARSVLFGHLFVADEISMAAGDVTAHLHSITESVGKRHLELRGTGRTIRDLPVSDDEIDAAGGDRLEAIRRKWDDDAHLGRYIHPEFRFAATTNPVSYAGTSDMNGAFRSRFATLELDYLEPKHEATLLADKTGVDKSTAKRLIRLADRLRESHRNNELMCPITFRELEKTVELAGTDEQFMDIKDAARIILKGHASQKLDKETITDAITDEL